MTNQLDSDPARDYEVGHGKPPRQSQFQPGNSGNPKGRPKGKRNLTTDLLSALNERVTITENGRKKSITKQEAAVKQLVNKAASGNAAAMKLLVELMPSLDSLLGEQTRTTTTSESDKAVMASLRQRLLKSTLASD